MNVFPNPSANDFYFELDESYQDIEVRVFSFTGSIVALEKFESTSQFNIVFKAMPGKYLTHVYGDGELIHETILIKQ
ncbi:MAG: T9SS type A sorting domain-containing protein [Crocinitomicaceae bacterium]|nr:T9SS type A sorting domain-containing protein [Crocinitomicaceae bacterium]